MKPTDTTLNKDFVQGPDKPEPPEVWEIYKDSKYPNSLLKFYDEMKNENPNTYLIDGRIYTITFGSWDTKD